MGLFFQTRHQLDLEYCRDKALVGDGRESIESENPPYLTC